MPSLADYILSFCSQSKEAEAYARTHLERLVRTLEITPPGSANDRALEMGAYMQITPALQSKLGYGEVRGCYLGPAGQVYEQTARSSGGKVFRCPVDLFNAEKDPFPYPDGHFKTVLCCELLEHLSEDPMHMMAEVNRILVPGGYLVLSTPNITSLRAVKATLAGYHPGLYSQYIKPRPDGSIDPRHSREFTPKEVVRLLEAAGFETERLETGPYGDEKSGEHEGVAALLEQHGFSTDLRGEVIHAVGKKVGPVNERYPDWLYEWGGAGQEPQICPHSP